MPRPLNLLVSGINWPPETFLRRLIDGLLASGVEVTVGSAVKPEPSSGVKWLQTPSWDAPLPVRLARLGAMAGRAALRGQDDLKVLARSETCNDGLGQRLRIWNQLLPYAGRRWDVIYFPWNSAAIAHLPVFDLPSPVAVSCRGTQVSVAPHNPERVAIREGLRHTFQKASAVHCVSEATLQDACRLGLDPAKARVIRPAVDPVHFRPAESRIKVDDRFTVMTVGTLAWVKGHEWSLQAIRRLADKGVDVRFEIIGDGPDRQRVLYTIADLGLQDRVRLPGKLGPDEVLKRVQQADAFLLSSHSEGISNAALEAMACGVPVVTTDCGGMREAVTDGVEGFVVPVRDAEAMASRLLHLSSDAALRQRMGEAARGRVQREFSVQAQVQAWLELYASILEERGLDRPLIGSAFSVSGQAKPGFAGRTAGN